ncbi:aminotransferase class IV [Dysgonomonas sp. Marseille-P4361]|uniref:aminotransferase class IV n=1 Tax=Dysgonomonas sp. Marseille-P4361 TaxID=2161820 RepID=UPI000D55CE64|nr:aminotransferase class IV [Dysgonomonas sp. Marseille-P4361]
MKNEPFFIETIKVVDGKFLNLAYHMDRMNRTMITFFNTTMFVELWKGDIPEALQSGVTKCRIVYSYSYVKTEYEPYHYPQLNSLKLVEGGDIDYSFKFADRSVLQTLLLKKEDCSEILIIKDGHITDTSFSNVVLEDRTGLYTPSTYLLGGTKRKQLLDKGIVKEKKIRVEDIHDYSKLYLINAMIDLEDTVCVDIDKMF